MRIVGVELGVRGRRHLDSHRPALFVFNRQSALDPLIVGRLVRRDFAPLLRREIAESRLYRVVDAVAQNSFLKEPESAGDAGAHERALRTLRDGISITVDPETTRTPTPRLAPFRIAPFRIAADAGVPVVPIVIRDSAEALPGGALVVRSRSVNVEVLKPISTSAWTPRTLRHHIDAVHAQFEEVLDSLRGNRLSSRPSSSPSGGAATSCAPSSA